MFPVFRHRAGTAMISEVALDIVLSVLAMLLAAITMEAQPLAGALRAFSDPLLILFSLAFAISMVLLLSGLGMYRSHEAGVLELLVRLIVATALAGYLTYLMLKVANYGPHPRVLVGYAVIYYILGVVLVRGVMLYRRELKGPPRVLIVGTGPDAEGLADDMRLAVRTERIVAGFYPISFEGLAGTASPLFAIGAPLPELVRAYNIDEIVVAVRDHRRGGVPLDDLLQCRSMGVKVHDVAGFYEMTHAEVPLRAGRPAAHPQAGL
jgi:FlaA1/EpsC-like NDP-sugar epimerase